MHINESDKNTALIRNLTLFFGGFLLFTDVFFLSMGIIYDMPIMLTPGGKLVLLYMAWLPFEDTIAGKSEELVLKYNPGWKGAGEKRKPIWIPDVAWKNFDLLEHEEYDVKVPFTRESWHGRMKACRGVGASLNSEELKHWEAEHRAYMETVPEQFEILHYAAISVLERR